MDDIELIRKKIITLLRFGKLNGQNAASIDLAIENITNFKGPQLKAGLKMAWNDNSGEIKYSTPETLNKFMEFFQAEMGYSYLDELKTDKNVLGKLLKKKENQQRS